MDNYIKEHIMILKELHTWGSLTKEEKAEMRNCTSEIQVDNMMSRFRRKYM